MSSCQKYEPMVVSIHSPSPTEIPIVAYAYPIKFENDLHFQILWEPSRATKSEPYPSMTEIQRLKLVNESLKKKFKGKNLIFGSGFIGAKIVFVGEAPGADEEKEGQPISGHSQKILNQVLRTLGINKNKIYLTNVLKYNPTGKKIPTQKEIRSYVPFLKEEIKTIGPRVVVTLGNMALNGIGLRQPLHNIHGRTFNFGSYELVPTFHPKEAAGNPQIKIQMETDLAKVKELLNKEVLEA